MEGVALSREVIGAAIEVHRCVGPGLLEGAYRGCLTQELRARGLKVEVEVPVALQYKGLVLERAYRLDLLVEDTLVLELKTVASLLPIHAAQLLTYLRMTGKPTGLLINFSVPVLRDGIRRISL